MNVKNRTCECLVLGNFYRSSTYRKARCKLKKKRRLNRRCCNKRRPRTIH